MEISDAILATLAYYDGFEYPLTAFEIYRYLVNPQRLRPHIASIETITLREIMERIEELLNKGAISEELGFYMLRDRSGLGFQRLRQEKIAAQKWRRCLKKAVWLQLAPWIRGIFVSGSLALGCVDQDSDFDLLVIVESGRLYLARLILSGVASLIGARRTRFETKAPDKFCFNHYITTGNLKITHESLYNAQTYARLAPILIEPKMAGEFFVSNLWINKFVFNFTPHQQTVRRTVPEYRGLRRLARLGEKVLAGPFGNLCERWARQYQQQRIAANPATRAPGGRVIYTNAELEFHPYSFERVILEHYNTLTRKLGLAITAEPDSGLRQ